MEKQLTVVEWLSGVLDSILDSNPIELGKVRQAIEKAKEIHKEQKQLEYRRGFEDGYQRKNQELDHLRGKNHSCQDNFKSE